MWRIQEHHSLDKIIEKLPLQAVKKYELWKDIVFRHGPGKLREFPGFHDEKLKGALEGQRSSRLKYSIPGHLFRRKRYYYSLCD